MNIHVGDEIELTEEVVPENTAEKWGSGSLPVYATPAMISLIEQSAVNLLAGKLDEGQTTVGTNLNIAHVSATPVCGTIKCHCSLTEIDRKRLVFHVEVTDNKGRVGIGTHERFIVASEPFMEKAAKKLAEVFHYDKTQEEQKKELKEDYQLEVAINDATIKIGEIFL